MSQNYRRSYYLANRQSIIAKSRANQVKNRARRKVYMREYMQERRLELLAAFGGKCKRCGFSDPRALQIDHVHGGGRVEILSGISTNAYAKRILADKTGKYQLLCANCNWIKKHENGETGDKFRRLAQPTESDCLDLFGEAPPQNSAG